VGLLPPLHRQFGDVVMGPRRPDAHDYEVAMSELKKKYGAKEDTT
jgi:hypothetical protein